jgi:hypothetical protein
MAVARYAHTATLLPGGRVLVVGGIGAGGASTYLQSAEIYDPATGRWRSAAIPGRARAGHSATLLPGGTVLVAGGSLPFETTDRRPDSLAGAELYDPSRDLWSPTRILNTSRGVHSATLLGGAVCGSRPAPSWCGAVLVAGGGSTNDDPEPRASPIPLASAELYR